MKHSDFGSLPPCVLSTQCQRLLDDLTSSDTQHAIDQVFTTSARDRQDERLVEQLRDHLPHCPTCAATLAQASRVRNEQRLILRRYLNESQAIVPSTTARIFEAAQEEKQQASPASSPTISRKRLEYMLPELVVSPAESNHNGHHLSTTDPLTLSLVRRWVLNGLSLATVAALLFAAIGIFGHFIFRSTGTLAGLHPPLTSQNQHLPTKIPGSPVPLSSPATGTASPGSTPPTDAFQGWNGLVLITGIGAMYNIISTYNYLNGDHHTLAESNTNMQFDGVGSHGQNMLYQVVLSGHTLYYTLHLLPTTGFFYELDQGNALNAIWMPDNLHVLIATVNDGVIELNTQNGQSQPFLPSLNTTGLKFYRGDYLYFLGGADRAADTLFRINVKSGVVQQVTGHSTGGDFWLSPDGFTVYYKNADPANNTGSGNGAGIYAVSSDGTSSVVLRSNGQPIGYAPDDSLVIMRQVNQTFEVVQLGATPEQDQVLLRDAAPGAISLCDPSFVAQTICDTTNIALAPLSHALVVIASYPDGSRKVWSDDLTTGKQFVMMTPTSDTLVMVPGWDRIAVA